MTLAGVGIYGVMTYVVSQRTKEIGIQMALGARSGDVLRSVALSGLKPVAAGMIIGLGCGAAASALLHILSLRLREPATFSTVCDSTIPGRSQESQASW